MGVELEFCPDGEASSSIDERILESLCNQSRARRSFHRSRTKRAEHVLDQPGFEEAQEGADHRNRDHDCPNSEADRRHKLSLPATSFLRSDGFEDCNAGDLFPTHFNLPSLRLPTDSDATDVRQAWVDWSFRPHTDERRFCDQVSLSVLQPCRRNGEQIAECDDEKSTNNRDVRQRSLQLIHALVGDVSFPEVELLEFGQPFQMKQPSVGDRAHPEREG